MGPEDKTDPGYPNRTTDEDPKHEDETSTPDDDYDNGSGVWSSLD